MIIIKPTPNNAGVAILGDHNDFETLYESLHELVGEEDDHEAYASARMRILGVCYDLRHALQGDRELRFVPNGMDQDKIKWMGIITHDTNVYLEIQVLWPEMLFVMMALNDFCQIYGTKLSKEKYTPMLQKQVIWNRSIAQARLLQSEVLECLKAILEPKSVSRLLNLMVHNYPWVHGYFTQYLDVQNVEFLKMDKSKRVKHLTVVAKRLTDVYGSQYLSVKKAILNAAVQQNRHPDEVRLELDYPEVEW